MPAQACGWRKWALAAGVWLAMFSLLLMRVGFLNDHFDRISRARQILVYGDRPFADFRDPGYFLTLYASAAGQSLTGGGLLGETVVASAAIATAGAFTFWLAASATTSLAIGLLAALLMWAEPPRYYDYDKVFFYMAGLAACWRYIDSPRRATLAIAGLVTTLAALFRYDNGLYLLVACVAAIVIRRRSDRSACASDLTTYVAFVVAAALPALIFIQLTSGLSEAVRQVVTYARTEGHRSRLLTLPPLAIDRVSATYALIVLAAPIALIHVVVRARAKPSSLPFANAKIAAAALLLLCVSVFVLRDPVGARLGAAAPLALVVAAGVVSYWHAPRARADATRRSPAWRAGAVLAALGAIAAGVVYPGGMWRVARAPFSIARRIVAMSSELRESPPRTDYFPDEGALAGLAAYLHTCTPPDARVLLTWFAPEVFFFSQRGFAGGMTVFLGEHWSSDDDERRTVEQLESQLVPLVIVRTDSEESFRSNFPLVAEYLDATFRFAAAASFGDRRVASDGYRVLLRNDLRDVEREALWHLPCPVALPHSHSSRYGVPPHESGCGLDTKETLPGVRDGFPTPCG